MPLGPTYAKSLRAFLNARAGNRVGWDPWFLAALFIDDGESVACAGRSSQMVTTPNALRALTPTGPQFPSFYRVLIAVLVFTLPISLMLVLSPILNFGVVMPVAHWSMSSFRKNRLVFDQLRRERDAVIQ